MPNHLQRTNPKIYTVYSVVKLCFCVKLLTRTYSVHSHTEIDVYLLLKRQAYGEIIDVCFQQRVEYLLWIHIKSKKSCMFVLVVRPEKGSIKIYFICYTSHRRKVLKRPITFFFTKTRKFAGLVLRY